MITWCTVFCPATGAHQAMLPGMRPNDALYAAIPMSNGARAVDGTLGCVIMVSPVIDPLDRYHYAKGLRDDVKPRSRLASGPWPCTICTG